MNVTKGMIGRYDVQSTRTCNYNRWIIWNVQNSVLM